MGRVSFDDMRDAVIAAGQLKPEEVMALPTEELREKYHQTKGTTAVKSNSVRSNVTKEELLKRQQQEALLAKKLQELADKSDSFAKFPFMIGKMFTDKDYQHVWKPEPEELELLSFFIKWGAEYLLAILSPQMVCIGGLGLVLTSSVLSRIQLINMLKELKKSNIDVPADLSKAPPKTEEKKPNES